jgi:hypothetical protein
MWSREDKVWMHYLNDIIAADVASAVFLSSYMRHALRGRTLAAYHEIADLQRYKMLRDPKKVRLAMANRVHLPFVFVMGKN